MISDLLPPCAAAAEAFADRAGEPVYPGEESAIARSVETRRREFVTARHLLVPGTRIDSAPPLTGFTGRWTVSDDFVLTAVTVDR